MKAVYETPRVYFEAFAANDAIATCGSGNTPPPEPPIVYVWIPTCWKKESSFDAATDAYDFSSSEKETYIVGMSDTQTTGYSNESSSVWCTQNENSKTISYEDVGYWNKSHSH